MRINQQGMLCIVTIAAVVGIPGFPQSFTASAPHQQEDKTPIYIIHNVFDVHTRSAIARTGANILEVGHDYLLVEATEQEFQALSRLGVDRAPSTEVEAATKLFHL